jgi:hypothetical protein
MRCAILAGNCWRSSIYERSNLTKVDENKHPTQKKRINVLTLDHIIKDKDYKEPFGLKVDTEGFELEVLKGGEKFLKKTEFLILEMSVAKRFNNSYSYRELIDYLYDHDFILYDVLEVAFAKKFNGIPLEGTVFMDGYFVNTKICEIPYLSSAYNDEN